MTVGNGIKDTDITTAKILLAHKPMWEATVRYGPFTGQQLATAMRLLGEFVEGYERQMLVNDAMERVIHQQIELLRELRESLSETTTLPLPPEPVA